MDKNPELQIFLIFIWPTIITAAAASIWCLRGVFRTIDENDYVKSNWSPESRAHLKKMGMPVVDHAASDRAMKPWLALGAVVSGGAALTLGWLIQGDNLYGREGWLIVPMGIVGLCIFVPWFIRVAV